MNSKNCTFTKNAVFSLHFHCNYLQCIIFNSFFFLIFLLNSMSKQYSIDLCCEMLQFTGCILFHFLKNWLLREPHYKKCKMQFLRTFRTFLIQVITHLPIRDLISKLNNQVVNSYILTNLCSCRHE